MQVNFVPGMNGKRLVFEGIRAEPNLGTIAIDDVTVFDGRCDSKDSSIMYLII